MSTFKDRLFSPCRCLEDVRAVKVDPTGTAPIRRQFYSALAIKWRRVRTMVRAGIIDQDILGLGATPSIAVQSGVAAGATKIQIFQRWMDTILGQMVVNDATTATPYIQKAYDDGYAMGERMTGRTIPSTTSADRVGAIAVLAHVELQGIVEAVSQNAVRAVANGLLNGSSKNKILSIVMKAIDSIGTTRTKTMVELLVVKAFGDATLDAYESAGIKNVGLLPEAIAGKFKGVKDSAVGVLDLRRRLGPGSRVPRTRVPSARTIGRIRAVEKEFLGTKWVNVETAGDDRVCDLCDSIADYGPYKINAARSLIPAHPYCRCIFIPADAPAGREDD